MSDKIIILGNEEELIDLASEINKQYCAGNADVVMYNDQNIGQVSPVGKLFLIGHADALGIGDYGYAELVRDFGGHLKNAQAVYLAGCSTADEAAQILNNGFVPLNLAKNVKDYTNGVVFGTPGVLTLNLTTGQLSTAPALSSGYKSTDIFAQV
ncbi:hypothetical protein [Mucilaginibacter jinjuensis]|uniref:CHAT domain-containing protein n=1 Tax=Mucilaginibacter jinjuensis TaxID=1176721 RepID=A0ABY7TFM4_9SPHI|nr:hypothetical protein [Mucilaginibacter jinjuensis]WCT14412.1 hypothetical protein PQO05_10760 [Mucilaginibacter jinjuensis]